MATFAFLDRPQGEYGTDPDGEGRTNALEMAKRTLVNSLPLRLAVTVDDPRSNGSIRTASSSPSFALTRSEILITAVSVIKLFTPCAQSLVSRTHVPLDRASATTGPGTGVVASTNQAPLPVSSLARPIHAPQTCFRGPSVPASEEQADREIQPSMAITQPRPGLIPRV
jgi:hypothetical protein